MLTRELEDAYLDVRYFCEAYRVRIRGTPAAEELRKGLDMLCGELRGLLAREGRDRVTRVFPRELLEKSTGELERLCVEAARRLYRLTGSRAAQLILEALGAGGTPP